MKLWPMLFTASCVWGQVSYAQTGKPPIALDAAFIQYLVEFGEQPELFEAANHELEQQTTQQPLNPSKKSEQSASHTKEIKP